jgi:hypothetical protein
LAGPYSRGLDARLIEEAIGREKAWLEERRLARRRLYEVTRHTPDGKVYEIYERMMPNGTIAVTWTEI